MVRIGFLGCHEISWFCLKRICELIKEFDDELVIAFNLKEDNNYSGYIKFDSLQKEFDFDLKYISKITDEENLEILKKSNLDILFIIGWHRIVPEIVLKSAKISLGIHSSNLPKDRGSSPINWEIIKGEEEGGVSLFHLTEGVDSGPIVDTKKFRIDEFDDVKDVYEKATKNAIILLEKHWNGIHQLQIPKILQNESNATYNIRRKPEDGLIDWSNSSKKCYDWIRALTDPYPGAFTFWKDKKVILLESEKSDVKNTIAGEILKVGKEIVVSTGDKSLKIKKLKIEDEPICSSELFSNAYGLKIGNKFSNNRE